MFLSLGRLAQKPRVRVWVWPSPDGHHSPPSAGLLTTRHGKVEEHPFPLCLAYKLRVPGVEVGLRGDAVPARMRQVGIAPSRKEGNLQGGNGPGRRCGGIRRLLCGPAALDCTLPAWDLEAAGGDVDEASGLQVTFKVVSSAVSRQVGGHVRKRCIVSI